MRGELLNVWEDTYREIWTPLSDEGAGSGPTCSLNCMENYFLPSGNQSARMLRSSPSATRFNSAKPLIEHYQSLASGSNS